MSNITVQNIADKVRANINRVEPLDSGGSQFADATPDNVRDTPGRTVHDQFIIETVDNAQRLIVQACKAYHLSSLILTHTGSNDRYNDLENIFRTLDGRVERLGSGCTSNPCEYVVCRPRGFAQHEFLENAGRSATPCYPAYTEDDGLLKVYPEDDDYSLGISVRIDYVNQPTELTAISDTLEIDSRFEGALVALVSSQAFMVVGEIQKAQVWRQIYERRLFPYLRSTYIGQASGFAGPLLSEQETEIE